MGTPTPTASPTSPTSSPTAPTSTVSPAPGVGQSLVQNVALTFTQNVAQSDWTGNLKNVCDCGYGRTIGSHTSTCSIVSGWTSASTFISRRGINTVRFTSTSETRTAAQLQASADQLVSSSTTMAQYITAAGQHYSLTSGLPTAINAQAGTVAPTAVPTPSPTSVSPAYSNADCMQLAAAVVAIGVLVLRH